MENTQQEGWMLENLHIHKNYYKSGYFEGNVTFKNGLKMQFSLALTHEKCARMVSILNEEIVESAKNLGAQMIAAMPIAIEAPKEGEIKIEDTK